VTLCALCKQKIELNTSALVCSVPCKGKFHLTCTTVSKLKYREVKIKAVFVVKAVQNPSLYMVMKMKTLRMTSRE
jgi:hypothetical protein